MMQLRTESGWKKMGRLVIDGNSVYEIDEECERKKMMDEPSDGKKRMEQRWNEGAAKARLGNIGRILTGGREDLPPHEKDETAKGSAAKAASVSIAPAAAAAEEQDDPETAVVTSFSTAIAAAVMSPTAAAAEKQDDPKRVVSASASAAARCRAVTSTSTVCSS